MATRWKFFVVPMNHLRMDLKCRSKRVYFQRIAIELPILFIKQIRPARTSSLTLPEMDNRSSIPTRRGTFRTKAIANSPHKVVKLLCLKLSLAQAKQPGNQSKKSNPDKCQKGSRVTSSIDPIPAYVGLAVVSPLVSDRILIPFGNSLPSRPIPFVRFSRLAILKYFSSVNLNICNQIIVSMCCLILIGKGRSRTRQVQSVMAARHRV